MTAVIVKAEPNVPNLTQSTKSPFVYIDRIANVSIYRMVDSEETFIPRRIRKDYGVRRAEIVASAIRLIGRRGYNATTIQMLAESCGMTKAGWLHYFASKDAMLNHLLDELERRDTELLGPIVTSGMAGDIPASHDALMQLLDTMVTRLIACPDFGRFAVVLQGEAIDPDHPAYDRFLRSETLMFEAITALLGSAIANPTMTARHLYAVIVGLAQQWLRASLRFDLLSAWHELSETILPGARYTSQRNDAAAHEHPRSK